MNFLIALAALMSYEITFSEPVQTELFALRAKSAISSTDRFAKTLRAAESARSKGNLDRALKLYRQSLALAEAAINQMAIAASCYGLADVLTDLANDQEALRLFERAAQIYERLRLSKPLSGSLYMAGYVAERMGLFSKALDLYSRSLVIKKKVGKLLDIGNVQYNMADIYQKLGRYKEAIEFNTRALENFELIHNSELIGDCLNNTGSAYYSLGQFDTALSYYTRGLATQEKLGDQQDIGNSLNNIGIIYRAFGQFGKALEFYERSLECYQKAGDQQDIGDSLTNIGSVNERLGNFNQALAYHLRALAIFEKVKNQLSIGTTLCKIGADYLDLHRYDLARVANSRALTVLAKLNSKEGITVSLSSLGDVCRAEGSLDESLQYYQRVLGILRKDQNGNDLVIASTLRNLGECYHGLRRQGEAIACYSEALGLFEEANRQVGNPSDSAQFRETTQGNLVADFAALKLQDGKLTDALALADRDRGRALSRQIAFNAKSLPSILSPEDMNALRASQRRVTLASCTVRAIEVKLENASGSTRVVLEAQETQKRKELEDAERNSKLVRDSLFARYKEFKLISGENPRSGSRLLQLGRDNPDTLFIEYVLLDEELLVFAINSSGLKAYEIKIKKGDLEGMVRTFLSGVQGDAAAEARAARELFTTILVPLEKDGLLSKPTPADLSERQITSAPAQHIVFVPDGPLLEVPFAALIDSSGKRLIETHAISNATSLGVLTWDNSPRNPSENMLVIADPRGEGGSKVVSLSRGASFGALPGAKEEGKQIHALVPGAIELVGSAAKEADIKNDSGKYAILHFATHGSLNPIQEMLSALVLASEYPEKSEEDGFLEAREIIGLPLSAQLAVLSACNTGEGHQRGGEGLMGLAWAFRAAGVPSIVASKWAVDDDATRRIMVRFYQVLLQGAKKDDALRAAMLEEMQTQHKLGPSRAESVTGTPKAGVRSATYYWAAFQLIGTSTPLMKLPKN